MPWLIEWLMVLSNSKARCVRHTACEVAMELFGHLGTISAELQSMRAAKEKLQTGKQKKKDNMAATLAADAQKLDEQEQEVGNMMTTIFEQIFVHRYRDSHDEIRAVCIAALGKVCRARVGWPARLQVAAQAGLGALPDLARPHIPPRATATTIRGPS